MLIYKEAAILKLYKKNKTKIIIFLVKCKINMNIQNYRFIISLKKIIIGGYFICNYIS